MSLLLKWLSGSPWLLGGVLALAVAGWGAAGWQTIRYFSARADLEATRAQVALDANAAAASTIAALKAAHAREMAELQNALAAGRQAVADARAENARLNSRLGTFQRELEALKNEPETRAYLDLPMPAAVVEQLRRAQHRNETGTD